MLLFQEALNLISRNVKQLAAVKVSLQKSVGMILAENLCSRIAMPPFNKSAMDGYALCACDVEKVPVTLRCLTSIEAGISFNKTIRAGECAKIMTGAPIPKGADSVVMVEYTQQIKDSVCILKKVIKKENVCVKGEDIKINQKVLSEGRKISVSDISLIAAIGRSHIKAIGKPRVAVLNTGGEIIPPGKKLVKNKIYNSNGLQLQALLLSDNIEPVFLGIAKDKPKDLEQAIRKGLECDVLLISGGVSMGDYDLVPAILKKCNVRKIFHKVKIKPGKPLFFGKRKNAIVFGIPGNPVSNFLTYQVFIRPALSKMMGKKPYGPKFSEGIIEKAFHHKAGRKHFIPAKISKKGVNYYVTPIESHGSADVLALSRADGFMVVEADRRVVKAKSKVKFIIWEK
ncbi:MAG: molybdopterin molybdotransferase MoeA [Candidatus Omnitrophica bacterium]|nr:molybdopterin molybdotransferase MoeA [Candidatus Omnitrophota bacterium]